MNPRYQLFWIAGILAVVALASFGWWSSSASDQAVELRMATGPVGGAFHSLGQGIAESVHEADPNCCPMTKIDNVCHVDKQSIIGICDIDPQTAVQLPDACLRAKDLYGCQGEIVID